jgi:hypothetical protein
MVHPYWPSICVIEIRDSSRVRLEKRKWEVDEFITMVVSQTASSIRRGT